MSNPILQDLKHLKNAIVSGDVLMNAYETGFLQGRIANDNWTKIGDKQPVREDKYLVSNGKQVNIADWNGSGFTGVDFVIKFWQLLPVIPRSEVGRD